MNEETYRRIRESVTEMLRARKNYPDLYTDDRIIVLAICTAAVEQPDAPVIAVYQAVRTELARCLTETANGEE